MTNNAITVPLRLTGEDIQILVEELNDLESSRLRDFIEKILRQTDSVTQKLSRTAREICEANPYSQQHKERTK